MYDTPPNPMTTDQPALRLPVTPRQSLNTGRNIQIAVMIALLVAMVARFAYLLQIEHNVDHAYSIGQALTTLATGATPLVGQDTSLQFPNGALLGYLYLPFLALIPHIIVLYVIIITLNTLAVYLTYRTVALLYTPQAGLWGACLMAVNPWIIEYSRSTWTHALMPFFLAMTAFLLWRLILRRSPHPVRDTILMSIIVTIVTQVALLGYFILPHVGLLVLRYIRRLPVRGLIVGGLIFIAFNAVFIVGLSTRLDVVSQQTQQMLTAGASETASLRSEPFTHSARLVSGAEYEINRGLQAPIDDAPLRHTLSQGSMVIITGLLIMGVMLAIVDIRQPASRDTAVIVLVWWLVPMVAMAYNSALIHPFYLLMGLPAGFALAGRALATMVNGASHGLGRGAWVIAIVLMSAHSGLMLVNSGRYYQETAIIPGAHGLDALSLDYALPVGEAIRAHLPQGGRVYAPVEGWIIQSFATQYFPTSQFTRAPQVTLVPEQGGLYLMFHEGDKLMPPPPASERVETFVLPDDTAITLERFAPAVMDTYTVTTPINARGEFWMDFMGYDAQQEGDKLTLTTYWRVQAGIEDVPDLAMYTFAPFVHLLDEAGQLIQVVDGAGVRGSEWHRGDIHIHQMVFDVPGGTEQVLVGQYDGVRNEGLIFITEDGLYTPTLRMMPMD